jgi:nicotinamide riboside transporter PnuC
MLQVSLTVTAILLLVQSITAGLFLSGVQRAFAVHRDTATAAGITLMISIVAGVLCALLRGERWHMVWAGVGLLALLSLQAFAGYRSITALHIPLGVITICAAGAVAAWSWSRASGSPRARPRKTAMPSRAAARE